MLKQKAVTNVRCQFFWIPVISTKLRKTKELPANYFITAVDKLPKLD